MSAEPKFTLRKPGNHRGPRKTSEPKIASRVATNWLAFAGIFLVLEILSLRQGTPTLSATVRTFPKSFIVFWVWFAGHILFGWKVPGEESLCRILRASLQRAVDPSGDER